MNFPLLPYQLKPRSANWDELGALYEYIKNAYGTDHSDAEGIVDASHIAVYDNCDRLIAGYCGKVVVMLQGGKPNEILVFTAQANGLRLARRYQEIFTEAT